jgi:hypothetical protein
VCELKDALENGTKMMRIERVGREGKGHVEEADKLPGRPRTGKTNPREAIIFHALD